MKILALLASAVCGQLFIQDMNLYPWIKPHLKHEAEDDRHKTIGQIITENGFEFEEHYVVTEDGYELTMHRIKSDGPPVLLQHGLLDCSTQWVINSADKAPAFKFARAGFDVWLGNNRGNFFSMSHVNYTSNQKEFWDFDFEQMGLYDQPAQIGHILEQTGASKLEAYVGHSEGTTQFFLANTMMPDFFSSRVKMFVALAPVVHMEFFGTPVMRWAAQHEETISHILQKLEIRDIMPRNAFISTFTGIMCEYTPHLCVYLMDGIWDYGKTTITNLARMPDKDAHSQSGAGWRNLVHYGQIIKDNRFQRLDYGAKGNQEHYRQATPPLYDLSKIDIPIAIVHGDIDTASNPKDVAWLVSEKSGLNTDLVKFEKEVHFAHWSFMMANDMSYVDDITALLKDNYTIE